MALPIPDRVAEIQRRLIDSTDCSDFFRYFFDCTEAWLLEAGGRRIRDENIQTATQQLVHRALGERVKVRDLLLIEIPGTPLVHGSCHAGGRVATIVYFRDLESGALAIGRGVQGAMTFAHFKPWQYVPMTTRVQ